MKNRWTNNLLKKLFFILFIFILAFGSGSISGGFNTGKSNHDSAWVNDQTELTGGNVDIDVAGKTMITGATIAAVDENGLDNGNLNLITNELEYSNIMDKDINEDTGFGIATRTGGGTDKSDDIQHPGGQSQITMKDVGSEKTGITHATIGSGNVSVGGKDITGENKYADMNRDINKSQVITTDKITGALDNTLTVDNNQVLNDPLDVLTKPWGASNTTLGLAWGLAGVVAGGSAEYDKENKVLIFTDNPIGAYGTAGTLGNTINFIDGTKDSEDWISSYDYKENSTGPITDKDKVHFKTHELKHRDQASYLGPLFLPTYIISGRNSASNWMEKQADNAGNQMYLKLNGSKK